VKVAWNGFNWQYVSSFSSLCDFSFLWWLKTGTWLIGCWKILDYWFKNMLVVKF